MRRTRSRTEETPSRNSPVTSSQSEARRSAKRGIGTSLSFLALPILLPILVLILMRALFGSGMMYVALASMIGYLVGPLGRELVIPAAVLLLMESSSVGIWEVVAISLSVACVDVSLALFVVWNFSLVRRSKYLARITDRIENAFTKRLGGGPTRRGYTLLAAYVAFPLQFSGGFIAAIIGSLLGYDPRRMVLAVTVGSVIGSLTVGILAYLVGRPIMDLLALGALQLAGILIVVGFIIAAVYLYHSHRRKKDED